MPNIAPPKLTLPKNYILTKTPCPVLKYTPDQDQNRNRNIVVMATPKFKTPLPVVQDSLISFPVEGGIMVVTLNRPKQLNSINLLGHQQLAELWNWFDREGSLNVAILTATGRAFCAGADLKEWDNDQSPTSPNETKKKRPVHEMGFGGMSRRGGKKPIILAVNGICFGGGCEMAINADLVLATPEATFALPEVKIGVVALAGALTRLVRTVGKQRAMEMALTGRTLSAPEAQTWGLINQIVPDPSQLLPAAIALALQISANSPDSVIVTREGIKLGWEGMGVEEGTKEVLTKWYSQMEGGENMREGVKSFVERRKPRWVESKL